MVKSDLSKYKKSFAIEGEKQLKPTKQVVVEPSADTQDEKLIMINFRAPVSLQRQIKQALVSDKYYGTTQNDFLVDAVQSYLGK